MGEIIIMSKFYQIGEVLDNGQIEKGASAQGMIYKSLEAFINKTGVCYVPELDDTEYTYMDFYTLANGNEKIARVLFDMVDWQSPETKRDELIENDEIHICINCENMYDSYEVYKCPHCGQLKVMDSFNDEKSEIFIFNVNNNEYKVTVNTDLMKKMDWSWESLIFADNKEVFAVVTNDMDNEISLLDTYGEVKIFDKVRDCYLSIEEISKLALTNNINDCDKYDIESNNWFEVIHQTNSVIEDDIIFETTPKTTLDVANSVLEFHLHHFDKK